MNGYKAIAFITFFFATFYAILSDDPVEDIHGYAAAICLMLMIIVIQLAEFYKAREK